MIEYGVIACTERLPNEMIELMGPDHLQSSVWHAHCHTLDIAKRDGVILLEGPPQVRIDQNALDFSMDQTSFHFRFPAMMETE